MSLIFLILVRFLLQTFFQSRTLSIRYCIENMTNSRRKTITTKSQMTLKSTFYWRGPFLDSFHYNDISFPEKRSHKGPKAQLTTWHERVNQGWKISRDNLCQIGSSLLILWNVFASCSIVFVEFTWKMREKHHYDCYISFPRSLLFFSVLFLGNIIN